jgi:biopolymer transport protein ExbB/TolQ
MLLIKDWIQLVLSCLTLFAVVYSAMKVINRNQKEWEENERRLTSLELDVAEMRKETKQIVGVEAKLDDLTREIQRVRDRLDGFLDRKINES